ncbi:hypothetical protein LSUE1_G005970 [Lachnellula suecica]|uniref:Ubiquitin-like protease family profile domain-containing protein n=1 Tax=Lachnellula suecica TaxID=602035 RepID=A0A8T9C6Q5_9HELO|nr:hypothetical protein LSUE1_G005970 [Lachnellula suecica]
MDVSNSSVTSWLDIAQMDVQQDSSPCSWPDEPIQSGEVIEDPIYLFGQFVSAVFSDAGKDIQSRPEFLILLQALCAKAPSVAQYLVQEILSPSKDDSQPDIRGSQELEIGTNITRSSRMKESEHQLPEPSRTPLDIPRGGAEDPHEASSGSSQVGTDLVTCQSGYDDVTISQPSDSLGSDQPLPRCEGDIPHISSEEFPQERVQGQPVAQGRTLPSAVHQLQATYNNDGAKRNAVQKQPSATFDVATTDRQTSLRPPSPTETEQKISDAQASSGPSSLHGTEPRETTLPGPTLSTPVRQIGKGCQSPLLDDQTATPQTTVFTPIVNREVLSPLTEDDRTASLPDKVDMTLPKRVASSLPSTIQQQTGLCNTASTHAQQVNRERPLPTQDSQTMLPSSTPKEILVLADMVAKAVHIIYRISSRQEVPTEIHSRILTAVRPSLYGTSATTTAAERPDSLWIASSPTTWSASMWINMLEAGHARFKEVTILNMIEWMGASEWYDAELQQAEKAPPRTKRGTLRKRLATIVLDKYLKEVYSTAPTEGTDNRTSADNEDRLLSLDAAGIQTRILNTRRKRLNKIFHKGRTLRKLVQMTHLGILFDPDIWSFAKASKGEVDKIAARFQEDSQKMKLLSILDEQVKLLAEEGRPDLSRFLDSLALHSIILSEEVSSLRAEYGLEREPVPQGYLDTALDRVAKGIGHALGKHMLDDIDSIIDIAAALEMTNRPVSVRLGLSIPLHKEDANGAVTPISNPLRRWRKKIDDSKCGDKNGGEGLQVYLCPLNVNTDHFSLLEINEQTKMIYHYDSMASYKTIHRKTKSTLEEFKYLSFGYTEAPTPQQKDGWSCGLMAIRNAKRRMIGLSVGTWDDEVHPDRVIKEVVGDCQTFLEGDNLQPSPLSKKRKKITDGLQNHGLEPSRSSKRLRR